MSGLDKTHFTLRHRLFRGLWIVCWTLLAAWTPPPLHAWRCLILRLFGAKVGKGVRIHGSSRIWYPPLLTLDDGAVVGWQTVIYCQAPIRLGRNAIVSQYAHLVAGTHDVDAVGFPLITKPIEIGANAWVASRAMVGPGVTLAEGAVLGAGGVACSNIPAWSIYAGNPARLLRRRGGPLGSTATTPWQDGLHETPLRHGHSLRR